MQNAQPLKRRTASLTNTLRHKQYKYSTDKGHTPLLRHLPHGCCHHITHVYRAVVRSSFSYYPPRRRLRSCRPLPCPSTAASPPRPEPSSAYHYTQHAVHSTQHRHAGLLVKAAECFSCNRRDTVLLLAAVLTPPAEQSQVESMTDTSSKERAVRCSPYCNSTVCCWSCLCVVLADFHDPLVEHLRLHRADETSTTSGA